MKDPRAWLLKAGATLLALCATLLSGLYVTSHLKNPVAPLQPPVLGSSAVEVASPQVQPLTSTYAS
jgi:hypothetical protein